MVLDDKSLFCILFVVVLVDWLTCCAADPTATRNRTGTWNGEGKIPTHAGGMDGGDLTRLEYRNRGGCRKRLSATDFSRASVVFFRCLASK